MSLNKRETEFCRFFVTCRDGREAAAKAGFAFPERSGMRLLGKQAILSEIDRLSQQVKTAASAVDGLRRIAFGSVTDAIKLVLGEEPLELEELDLFMVSEIKKTDKGVEIKFYDRIKALSELLSVSEGGEYKGTSQFVEAIFKGAEAIGDLGRSVSDEV